ATVDGYSFRSPILNLRCLARCPGSRSAVARPLNSLAAGCSVAPDVLTLGIQTTSAPSAAGSLERTEHDAADATAARASPFCRRGHPARQDGCLRVQGIHLRDAIPEAVLRRVRGPLPRPSGQ